MTELRDDLDPTLNDDPPDSREVATWPEISGLEVEHTELAAGVHVFGVTNTWPEWVTVRSGGTITFDDIVIGRMERDPDGAPRLVLNLGWLKAAGLGLTVQNDPDVDRGRSGHVLQRPEPQPAPEPF